MNGPQSAQAYHYRRGEQGEEIVFRAALHTGPHRLAACAHAGHVEETHRWIYARQRMGPSHREIIGEVCVFSLAHSHGGYAEAEKTRVVIGQLFRIHVAVEHIRAD